MNEKHTVLEGEGTRYPERVEICQAFVPGGNELIRPRMDSLDAKGKPHFRYKLPISARQKLFARLRRFLANRRAPSEVPQVSLMDPFYQIKPEWNTIITYLYEKGALQFPRITFDPIYNDDPKLYQLRLWAAPSQTDGRPELTSGGYSRGVSLDIDEAVSKVIGEFLERYPLTVYRRGNFVRASINSLQKRGIHFLNPEFADHSSAWQKEKFPRRRFNRDTIFSFSQGESLTRGTKALIPAQMIYIGYLFPEGEPVIGERNTNGAGGMFTREEAILAGLYELIQRDAFLQFWLKRQTPPRFDLSKVTNEALRGSLEMCKRYNLEVTLLDVTSDISIPSVIAVILDRTGRGPAVSLGGGCGPNQEKAMNRAITEAIGVRSWLRHHREGISEPLPKFEDGEPFEEEWGPQKRLLLWYSPEAIEAIDFFISGTVVSIEHSKDKSFATPKKELQHALSLFADRGPDFEVFVQDLKHPLLTDLGYHAVKVFVPALLYLYMREINAPLGAKRIKPFSYKEGGDFEIHGIPHPFP